MDPEWQGTVSHRYYLMVGWTKENTHHCPLRTHCGSIQFSWSYHYNWGVQLNTHLSQRWRGLAGYNLGVGRLRRVGISYLVLSADQQHVPGLILAPAVSWVSPAKTMGCLVTAIHNIRHRSLSSVWLIIILNLNPGTTFLQPRPFRHHKLLVSKSKYGQELRWDMFSKMTIRHAMQSYFYWTSSNITISRSVDLEFV